MEDEIGKLPEIKDCKHGLQEIYKIASDKRHHVLLEDENEWLELKMKIIKILVRRTKKANT